MSRHNDRLQDQRRRVKRAALRRGKQLYQQVWLPQNKDRLCYVFVAGVQRSGTNMLMHVLENNRFTAVYHENDTRAFRNYELRDTTVLLDIARHCRAPVLVWKALCDLDRLPALTETFAPARLIWLIRAYSDVVNSTLTRFGTLPATVVRVANEGAEAGWWGRGLSPETHRLLQRHVARGVNDCSLAALMWYIRNIQYFEQGWDLDPRALLLSYEDLVTRPHEKSRQVYEFCGLRFRPAMVREVHAGSIQKRDRPAIDPEVAALCDSLTGRFQDALSALALAS